MDVNKKNVETNSNALLLFLRIGFVAILLLLSFKIIAPFILPIVWGIIISVGIYPIYNWMTKTLNGKHSLAATILAIFGISIFIVPFALLIMHSAESLEHFLLNLDEGSFSIPPPAADVADWPVIGEKLFDLWSKSSQNLTVLIEKLKPFIMDAIPGLFSSAAGAIGTVFQFVFSVIIAAVLLVYADNGRKMAISIFNVIIGENGEGFVNLSISTINSVVLGVLGTAVIQTVFLGFGMFMVEVPAAGVWTVLVLLVAIIQLPPTLVLIPIIIYVFSVESSTVAIVFTVWSILWSMADTFLKPVLMGKGSDLPMLVILIGALGGMVAFGIIGLFVGAVVLAISYEVFVAIGKQQNN